MYLPNRITRPSSSGSTRKKPEKPQGATAASPISAMPRPPRLPGNQLRSFSWLRRRNSSRSGGLDPGVCGPEPHGPRGPEPHGPPPPDWLLHGINTLLDASSRPALVPGVIGERTPRYNAQLRHACSANCRVDRAFVSHEGERRLVLGRGLLF